MVIPVKIKEVMKIVGCIFLAMIFVWVITYVFTITHESSSVAKNYILADSTIREEMGGDFHTFQNNSGWIRETRAYSADGKVIDESSTAFLCFVLVNRRKVKYLKMALWRGTEPEWKVYKAVLYSWGKNSIVLCDKPQWFSNTPVFFKGGF